jgi:hypothetical protein
VRLWARQRRETEPLVVLLDIAAAADRAVDALQRIG